MSSRQATRTARFACPPLHSEADLPLAWRFAIPLIVGLSVALWVLVGKVVIAIAC